MPELPIQKSGKHLTLGDILFCFIEFPSKFAFYNRTGLAGVKRKGLATELLSVKADSYHICWTRLWDTQMPAQLMAKVRINN